MFIAYTDIGLFRSENAGRSWTSATLGVPRRWTNTTYWITFDPTVKGRVWGVMSYVHDLPRPKMWRHTSPERYDGGVCVSDDGGRPGGRQTRACLPPPPRTSCLTPPARLTPESFTSQAWAKASSNPWTAGKPGHSSNQGLPAPQPFAWRLARNKNGVLYLVVARRSEDGSFGSPQDGALYRSRDGAEHWEKVPLPEGVNGPNGICHRPGRRRSALPCRLGSQSAHGGGRWRYLCFHGWRRDVAEQTLSRPTRLRRHHRPSRSAHSLRLRF